MLNFFIIFGAKYLLWLLLAIALVWFLKQSREDQKRIIIFGIVLLPIVFVFSRLIGKFYYDPRPFVTGNFIPLIPHQSDNGFPSDHILLAAAVAVALFPFSKKVSLVSWILTILIGVTRVLVGIHRPIDIIGSIIISVIVGFVVYYVLSPRLNQRRS